MRYFTHYWSNQWLEQAAGLEGQPLDHTAGNLFHKRDVQSGDYVYVISVKEGQLYLIGGLQVERICNFQEAQAERDYPVWEADDHILAKEGSETAMSFGQMVPMDVVINLRLLSGAKEVGPKFTKKNRLDQQTFRGVRELTAESAQTFEDLLKDHPLPIPTDEDQSSFVEGALVYRYHRLHERSSSVVAKRKRDARKKNQDLKCEICGFSFLETYGELGRGFIEAHHTTPLREAVENVETRPEDLTLVCSNCHRMLHRKRPWLSMKKLRDLIKTGKST